MTEQKLLKLVLSDTPGDIVVVGGKPNELTFLSVYAKGLRLPLVEMVSMEQGVATLFFNNTMVGAGCFISHGYDILDSEHRRHESIVKLMDLNTRLGFGFITEPIEIELYDYITHRTFSKHRKPPKSF